jgi:large subunit ribosomal protein L9
MEVILVKEVDKLGGVGDVVKVKPGFARNFLVPQGMALLASRKNKRELDHQRRIGRFAFERAKEADEADASRLKSLELRICRKVGEEEKLFGSVTSMDVERALAAAGVIVERRKIQLPEPIKTLGVFTVGIRLRPGLEASVRVLVEAE